MDAVLEAIAGSPAALRPALAGAADPVLVERRLGEAVDRSIAAQPPLEAPVSRLWTVLGLAATALTVLLIVAAAWLVLWVLVRPPVDSVSLPVVGLVPAPVALTGLALVVGLLPPRLLALHAGWVGRRWARSLAARLRAEVSASVADDAFAVVDRVEASRRALWLASRAAETGCG
jgi:hypothetical protein